MKTHTTHPVRVLRLWLKAKRLAPGSQAGFAHYLGVSESLIRAVEGGRVKMSLKLMHLISHRTGVSLSWLENREVLSDAVPIMADGDSVREKTSEQLSTMKRTIITETFEKSKNQAAAEAVRLVSQHKEKKSKLQKLGEEAKDKVIELSLLVNVPEITATRKAHVKLAKDGASVSVYAYDDISGQSTPRDGEGNPVNYEANVEVTIKEVEAAGKKSPQYVYGVELVMYVPGDTEEYEYKAGEFHSCLAAVKEAARWAGGAMGRRE